MFETELFVIMKRDTALHKMTPICTVQLKNKNKFWMENKNKKF